MISYLDGKIILKKDKFAILEDESNNKYWHYDNFELYHPTTVIIPNYLKIS